ncbi:SRPBCC domain-containing protein [Streptomyces lancefieldiae]|uniref:SRPBCC domain-containing protein n=1 Tax=Streptomyces lancefieldiae TaxID=3075520 RepID=A0ABU3AWW4_9ACTN|nr:SRPBCC domain-containing protein [Streptomyces sp. DSM 40712]MDT0614680.1 SRPBCC domain-containing protein [Streptomyces sp. DSM 40712]
MTTPNAINRPGKHLPGKHLPGTGDDFVPNEVIVRGRTAADGPEPSQDTVFGCAASGFPALDARVVEGRPPAAGMPGRPSWTAKRGGSPEERLDVPHARPVEGLSGGRVRNSPQESGSGRPAAELARRTPHPMRSGQAWPDGPVRAARGTVAG